jgi:hypothetical protein
MKKPTAGELVVAQLGCVACAVAGGAAYLVTGSGGLAIGVAAGTLAVYFVGSLPLSGYLSMSVEYRVCWAALADRFGGGQFGLDDAFVLGDGYLLDHSPRLAVAGRRSCLMIRAFGQPFVRPKVLSIPWAELESIHVSTGPKRLEARLHLRSSPGLVFEIPWNTQLERFCKAVVVRS